VPIDNIAAVAALAEQAVAGASTTSAQASTDDFGAWLQSQLAEVNQQLSEGDTKVQELATGEDANLHEVMLSLEKAKLSFELLLAIRNKALEAYQEMMRMQI
jgi:flagellar hook-basal body complex protein FliE